MKHRILQGAKVKAADEKADLKRGVDHIGVSIGAVVHDGKGHILLMKRGPRARDEQGRWDVCGGTVEFGESVDETVRREVAEELCAKVKEVEFLTAYEAHRKNGDVQTHWIVLINAALIDSAMAKIGEPDKIAEIGWFTLDDLPSPMHSQFPKAIDAIRKSGIANGSPVIS